MALTLDFIKSEINGGLFFSTHRPTIEYLLEKDLDCLSEYILLVSEVDVKIIQPEDIGTEEISNKEIYIDENTESLYWVRLLEKANNKIRTIGQKIHKASFIKSKQQIANVEKTLLLNKKAYSKVVREIKPGMTECEIFCLIKSSYNQMTNQNIEFVSDVISGERTSFVSGIPTDNQVIVGEEVILDLLPKYKGMYCDTTRTIFLGEPSKIKKDVYEIVKETISVGYEKLRPGVCAEDVYFSIYNHLKKYGYEKCFPHHAGHGLGRTIFEEPCFLPDNKTELKENMVVTLEPGIYLKNEFGIRLENNFVITNNGAKLLSDIPLGIEENIAYL